MQQPWIAVAVLDGIMNLFALRLSFSPPAEMIPKTAERWSEIVGDALGNEIEQVDAPRIREAFKRLERESTQWPAPKNLLDFLPPRPQRKALDAPPPSEEEAKEGHRCLKEIMETIGIG